MTPEATFRLRHKTEEVDQVGQEKGEGTARAEAADGSSGGISVTLKTTVAAALGVSGEELQMLMRGWMWKVREGSFQLWQLGEFAEVRKVMEEERVAVWGMGWECLFLKEIPSSASDI